MSADQAQTVIQLLTKIDSALSSVEYGTLIEVVQKICVGVLILAVLACVDRFIRKGALQG